MKKSRFLVVILIVLGLAALLSALWLCYDTFVDRSGWYEKEGVRYYQDFHAKKPSGWYDIGGERYFFEEGGIPVTGWQEQEGGTYYFDGSGVMHTGWLELPEKTCYFYEDGTMAEGWLTLDGSRYYLPDGTLATGWQEVDGKARYFHTSGILAVGMTTVDGETYYFTSDGLATVGELTIKDRSYYFHEDGTMATGWTEREAGRYYYGENGVKETGWTEVEGKRYYLGEDGVMQTGWLQMGEYRYYLQEDGSAAVGPVEIDGELHHFTPKGIEVVLVNSGLPVPDYYELNLVPLFDWCYISDACYDALWEMLDACEAAGNKYVFNSAYRSIENQKMILELRTEEHMKDYGLSYNDARAKALTSVAVPGTSEHHLGLAVDILGDEAIAWLTENCWEYGFIVRYRAEKSHITGIIDEPWHFRYVGTEVSLDMKDSPLCLEEYLGAVEVTDTVSESEE